VPAGLAVRWPGWHQQLNVGQLNIKGASPMDAKTLEGVIVGLFLITAFVISQVIQYRRRHR